MLRYNIIKYILCYSLFRNISSIKVIFLIIVLIYCHSAGYGASLDLINDKDLKCFETKKSTYGCLSDEFNDFIKGKGEVEYEKKLWKRVWTEKEEGSYEIPAKISDDGQLISTTTIMGEEEYPEAKVELPYQTRLSITGMKSISIKYGQVFYPYEDEDEERTDTGVPVGVTDGIEMEQELRVRIKGQVGEKITVNVDYDDTKPVYDEDARKISVMYKGDDDEIIQEAAFGDINLSLPSTKFVGYSKKVFGAKVSGKYKKLRFMAIGSQTKGKTDVKKFTGQTTFTTKDIKDISYTRRKYYDIDMGTTSSHLPITPGSVRVYIDDKDASNNDETGAIAMTYYEDFNSTESAATGSFYKLVAGRDYTIDNLEGILTLSKLIQSNYIIIVEYKFNEGKSKVGYSDYPVAIKDESETLTYELKNRYNLGAIKIMRDDFQIDFLDMNRKEVDLPKGNYKVDYDLGILEFTDDQPFYNDNKEEGYDKGGFENIYSNNSPRQHYIIYVEYKKRIQSYFLRPNILKGSERVMMDGEVLSRGSDYIIDYPSGFLTFIITDEIDETTEIEVTYEYLPFGGTLKETLVGVRSEYNFNENMYLGGTVLYKWASAPLEIPKIHSTPESTLVLDSDFNLRVPKSKYNPFPTTFSGEVAQSIYNPNTLGKAMIDNMEGVRQAYAITTDPESWQIARTPQGVAAKPGWLALDEDDVFLNEINPRIPNTDDEKKKVLIMNYRLPTSWDGAGDPERSIVYPLSNTGTDLSDKDTIELWIKGDGRGAELQFDFGSISEDADVSGELKTEDKNNNDTLDRKEDIGWNYIYRGSTYSIGDKNSEIDTNDLDGDGVLDTFEDFNSFDMTDDSDLRINWRGWKKIVIPRGGTESDWAVIKQIRITVKGSNVSGSIAIASVEAVGNKWEIGKGTATLNISAVNNYDDKDYADAQVEGEHFIDSDLYQDIYSEVGGSDADNEQALQLEYTDLADGATVYAYSQYSQAVDFSKHGTLSFLLYGEADNVDFYIEFGAGNDYFRKKVKVNFTGWQKFSYNLEDEFEEIGSPKLTNISQIRLGVVNNTGLQKSGKLWVNEIFLEDPEKKVGHAWRGSFDSSIPNILNFGGSYETMDSDFQTITSPPKDQDITTYSANARLIVIRSLPIYGKYSKSEIITLPDRIKPGELNPYLREEDSGKVIKQTGECGADFIKRRYPTIKGNYSFITSSSNFTGRYELSETVKGNASYSVPLRLFFLPSSINCAGRKTDTFVDWAEYKRSNEDDLPIAGFEDTLEETIEYSGSADFSMTRMLNFKPSYKKNEKTKRWNYYTGIYEDETRKWDWYQGQDVGLSSTFSPINWFRPNGSYNIKINEAYNFSSTNKLWLPIWTKDVTRNFTLRAGIGLSANRIIPWFKPFYSFNINTNYLQEKGETYKGIENEYEVFDKLDQRYALEPSTPNARLETLTDREAQKYTVNWRPFEFTGMDMGVLNIIGGMQSRYTYDIMETRRENAGTVLRTETEIWPNIDVTCGQLARVPFTGSMLTNIVLRSNYSLKEDSSFSQEEGMEKEQPISNKFLINYGGNCRFFILSKFDSLFEYSRQEEESIDRLNTEEEWNTRGFSTVHSGQIKFVLKEYWYLIPRYSVRKDWKESYSAEVPLVDTRIESPSLRFDAIINLPANLRLPFFGNRLSMVNRLKIIADLRADFSRSELNVEKTRYDKYTANFSVEMDISSNVRWTLGFGGQYLEYKEEEARVNSYIAVNIRTELVIRF
ncbi:carbohydrate binding domain-containing protein [Elusimicrobiota bacterium]